MDGGSSNEAKYKRLIQRISASGKDCGQLPTSEAAAMHYLVIFMHIRR